MIPPPGKLTNYPRHPLGNRAKRDTNKKKKLEHYDQQQQQQQLNCKNNKKRGTSDTTM